VPPCPHLRLGFALFALALLAPIPAWSGEEPLGQRGRFELTLGPEGESLRGSGKLELRNLSPAHVQRLPLVLYPARFRELDPEIDDVVFDRFYARWFEAGDMRLSSLESGGLPLATQAAPGFPEGSALWIRLPRPLAPGAWVALELEFELKVPERLGTFGHHDGRLILEGGFLPYLPRTDHGSPPARAELELVLAPTTHEDLQTWSGFLGGARVEAKAGAKVSWAGQSPALALGPEEEWSGEASSEEAPKTFTVEVLAPADEGADRRLRLIRLAGEAAKALADVTGEAPRGRLSFVQAPLRDRFLATADRVVFYSDRLFRVFPLLERFHELEVGRAVILSLVRQRLATKGLGPDRDWLCEAIAWWIARRWAEGKSGIKGANVRAGLKLLDFIPAFDRLLRAPRFPGSDLFYGRFYEPWDSVPDDFARALSRRARGRVALEKLRDKLGEAALEGWVKGALASEGLHPRAAAAALASEDLDGFFSLWLSGDGRRAPVADLELEELETLREHPDGTRDIKLRISRVGDPRIGRVGEPVEVRGVDAEDEETRVRWDGRGDMGEVVLRHGGGWFSPIELDPDDRINQSIAGPDRVPLAPFKLLVNRVRLRPDLNGGNRNEGALGVTIVPGYDYSHRVAIDAFYEQDERGVHLGYGRGFGWSIDQRRFGLGVGFDATAAQLQQGVLRSSAGLVESEGSLVSYGAGVSIDTRRFRLDPSTGLALGGHYEFADRHFGTDFRFHKFDLDLTLIYTPWRGTTFGAEVLLGQIVGNDIPTQRLFDAGGSGAVRGIRTSRFIDRAFIGVRGEIRQTLWTDLDLNFLYLLYLRRFQAVLFLDSGDVGRDLDAVFRARTDWKWGTGAGIRLWGDSFGVTRFVLRFDVGFRIDDTNDLGPQYYLGVGQSF
jgi:surface antigen Omp85-like protein